MRPFLEELTQLSSSLTCFQFRLTGFLTGNESGNASTPDPDRDLCSLLEELQAPLSTVLNLALRAETLLRSRSSEDTEERTVTVKKELILPFEDVTLEEEEKIFPFLEEGQGSTPEEFLLPESEPEAAGTLILPHEGSPSLSRSIQPNQPKEKTPRVKKRRKQEADEDHEDDPDPATDRDPFQDLWPDIPKQPDGTFRCPFPPCKVARLRYSSELRTHMGRKHKDDLESTYGLRLENLWHHKCGICGAVRVNKSALALHEQTHERSFPCMVCGSSFSLADSLRRHLNLHTGERKYSCEPCGKSFQQKHHLTSHQIAEHPEQIGHQWLNCDICEAQFKRKEGLRLHMKRQHPDN